MSNKNQDWTVNYNLKTKADFSQLIKSLNSVYNEIRSKADQTDILSIDKTLKKMNELQAKLEQSIKNGFSSPKELKDFYKLMDNLNTEASNLSAKFQSIHVRGLQTELKEASKNLKEVEASYRKVRSEAENVIKSQLTGVKKSKEYSQNIVSTAGNAEKLKAVQENITNEINDQISKQKELIDQKKAEIKIAEEVLETSQNERGDWNKNTHLTRNSFYRKSKNNNRLDVTDKQMQQIRDLFNNVTKETTATKALNAFKKGLKEIGVEAKNLNTIERTFNQAYSQDKEFNIEIEKTNNKIKSLNNEIKTSAQAISELEQSIPVIDTAINSKDTEEELKKVAVANDNVANATKRKEKAEKESEKVDLPSYIENTNKKLKEQKERTEEVKEETSKISESQQAFDNFTNSLQNSVKQILSITTSWRLFRQMVSQTFEDVKELDKSFAQIAMVTSYEVSDLWGRYEEYAQLANRLGQSTQSVVEASGLYYQQGLDTAEVMELTEQTMKLATLAGLDFKEATAQMTAAIRGFHMEMSEGQRVTDVYAEVAAHAAVDVKGLSDAMSATASIANSAGMQFETTTAMLATMAEVTQEAPKNLGTALKTVIARFTELKENVAGTADSEFEDLDYNKVDKALKTVGVQLKDTTGQFRNLDDVFLDLGKKWNTLDRNSQRYIATIAAGSRQQSRFIALMENYERTMELVDVAQNSAGKSQQQFAKFADSTEYKLNKLKNTFEQVRISLTGKGIFDTLIEGATKAVERLQNIDFTKILMIAPFAIMLGRSMAKNWIDGFSQGLNKGKGLINKALEKITPLGKTKIKIDADIKKAEQKLDFLEKKQENLIQQISLRPSAGIVLELSEAQLEADKLIDLISNLPTEIRESVPEYQEWNLQLEKALGNVEELKKKLRETDPDALNLYEENRNISRDKKSTSNKLTDLQEQLKKPTVISGVASALGNALATATMMAFTDTFSWSEIFTTTAMESGISAISTLVTGNWKEALGQAAIGAISWVASEVADYLEEQAELERENADQAYKIAKEIEKEKDKQEELNQALDDANKKYDDATEKHKNFTEATDTYEELSKKISLSEEEQEKLNEATQTLIELHPELISGYDSTGKAILKIGTAWDEVVKKENEAYQKAQLYQNQAEMAANAENLKIAEKQKQVATSLKDAFKNLPTSENQVEYLEEGIDKFAYYGTQGLQFLTGLGGFSATSSKLGKLAEGAYKVNLDEILSIKDSEDRIDRLQAWAKANGEYGEALLLTIKQVTDYEGENVDKAISLLNESDYFDKFREQWYQNITNPEKAYEDAGEFEQEANAQYHLIEDSFKTSIKDGIKILLNADGELDNFSDQQNQILSDLISKTLISDEEVQEAYESGDWASYQEKIANSDKAKQIVKELNNLTNAQKEIIDEYLNNYQIDEIIDTNKLRQQLEASGFGEYLIKYLTGLNDQLLQQKNELKEKIGRLFTGTYELVGPVDLSTFENSTIGQVFNQMGYEAANNFFSGLSQFDTNEAAQAFLQKLNSDFENNSINKDALSYLITIDWSEASFTNINQMKQEFLDYCSDLDITVEEAEQTWNNYKDFLSSLGLINLTADALSLEQLETDLDEQLAKKVDQSTNLATAVEKQLTNGFLNFSESQAFKKACEEIGIKAEDYLTYNSNGTIILDIEKLKEGLEDQKKAEQEIVLQLREEQKLQIDKIDAQISELQNIYETIDAQKERNKQTKITADLLWDCADAIGIMTNGQISSDQRTITYDLSNQTTDDVLTNLDKQINTLKTKRESLVDVLNNDLVEGSDFITKYMSKTNAAFSQIFNDISEKEETATKQAKENAKAAAEAYENWEKQVKTVNEKIEALNETIRGTEYFDSGIDSMYNYTTALERVTKAADDAKDVLEDLQDTDNASESMDKYLKAIHNEAAISEAEARVYAQAITNGQKVIDEKLSKEIERINKETGTNMSTDVSGLYKLVGDRYQFDIARINSLPMNDEIKKMIADELKSWNENLDKIEELEKKRRDRIKEYQKLQKDALSNVVNLEEEMKNTLKEKYEQEIEDVENKYKAMEEADNEYVDALEEAIKKQRELRDRENQWNDLANKERKLSLMQRDTSGSNRVATRQLEREVQDDRQELLDNSVDDIIDGLKEMYELQKESREAEIEYRKALIDEGMLMREVTAALANIDTADDLVAWFYENTANLSDMSEEQIKLEEMGWRDFFDAKTVYMETSQADFEDALLVTEADIAQVVNETSETLTTKADQTLSQIGDSVSEAIKKAQEDLEQARKDLQEKWEAYLNALEKTYSSAAKSALGGIAGGIVGGITSSTSTSNSSNSNTNITRNVLSSSNTDNPAEHYKTRSLAGVTDAKATINGGWTKTTGVKATIDGGWTKSKKEEPISEKIIKIIEKEDLDSWLNLFGMERKNVKNNLSTLSKKQLEHYLAMKMDYDHQVMLNQRDAVPNAFAKGGLVDFTGPAWVDGTKRAPEAFLSAEDTKRIGEAAKLLATSPLFNNTSWEKNDITNNTVGDTVIDIHVNIENVSSDYDVDQAIERVKQDIVDAAKYTGSNVILNKRV